MATIFRFFFLVLVAPCVLFALNAQVQAQAGPPFTCDGSIFQVQSGQLRIFDPVTSTYTNIGPQNSNYNATGFNVLDNFAYASQNGNIIRISANGTIENVFNIGFGSFSGDLDFSNNYYLRRTNNRYARINLSTGATVNVDFAGPGGGPADVAYVQDGGSEFLIGFSGAGGGTLYRYNITAQTKENLSLPGLPGGSFGAAWTDSTGRLFTFNNNNGQLYEVFGFLGNSPTFRLVGNGDPSRSNDGFSCSLAPFPNLAPLAFDDEFTGPLNVNVTGNVIPDNGVDEDNDPEGFPLVVNTAPLSGPSNGSVTLAADGSFTYVPNTNFVGVDTFEYQISDNSGLTATAVVTITITGTIDFTIEKTQVSGPDPVTAAGDVIGYEIVLTNIGDIPLTGVFVTDVLPDGSTAPLGTPVQQGGTGGTSVSALDVSETWTYTLNYTVTQNDIDSGLDLVNNVSATTSETGTDERSAAATTGVTSTPAFTIAKTALPTVITTPDTIAYEITIANTGNVTLTDVIFTDTLQQDGASLPLTSGPSLAGDLDDDGELDADETWIFTASFEATQSQIDNGADLVNTATFEAAEAAEQTAVVTTSITQTASLLAEKTSDIATISAPGLITYEITVENTGNVTLTDVDPVDTLTQGATNPPLTTGPLLVAGDTNSNGALDVDEIWLYEATFDVTQDQIDNGADIQNSVAISTNEGATGTADTTTEIDAVPSFTITKDVSAATLSEPGLLTYQIIVENTGNVSLTNVTLVDEVVQGTTTSAPTSGPTLSGDADGDGEVDPGEIWLYAATFDVTQPVLDAGDDIVNTATFSTAELDDQSASAITTLTQAPAISLVKAVATGQPTSFSAIGDTIDFTFVVTNDGNITLAGPINIDDDQIGNGLQCSAADLAPGEAISCDFTWTAEQTDLNAGSVTNVATATGGAGITSPPQEATVTAVQTPALSIVKTIDTPPATFTLGVVLNYDYVVTNEGNVTLIEPITVDDNITPTSCDDLPPGGLIPGASILCEASYTITSNDLALGSTTNVAFAETTFDGAPVTSPTDDAIFPVGAAPVLGLVKSGTPIDTPLASVGDQIEYSYTITNVPPATGTPAALNESILIDDNRFPAPFVCYDPAIEGGPFEPNDTHTCLSVPYEVTQADLDAGEVTNEAVAQTIFAPASLNPINVTSVSDTVTIPLDNMPGVALVKSVTAGPSPATVGDEITYSIVATNTGNQTLTNVTISDPLLPALSCDIAAPVTLAVDAELTCSGSYEVQQSDLDGQDVGNPAPVVNNTATGAANDPSGAAIVPPVMASATHPLEEAEPAVEVLKELFPDPTADPAFTDAGDNLQYRITVTNTGNTTLSSIDVTDSLVPGTCTVGPLAPDASDQTCFFTYEVTQLDIDAGEVLNIATATAQPSDPAAAPVVGTDDLSSPGPDAAGSLTVLKAGTLDLGADGVANPGDIINYTITITNTGNVTLSDIVVTDDDVDAGSITYTSGDDDTDGDIDSLAPDESVTVDATYTLTLNDINAGSATNSAVATGQDPSGTEVSDTSDSTNPGDGTGADDPTVTQIPRESTLTVEKTPSVLTGAVVDQVITYSYLVTNTGNVTLTNITLEDQHTSAAGTSALTLSDGGVIATLAPNETATLTAEYTVTQADIDDNAPLTNIVSANADAPDGSTPTASDDASVDLVTQTGGLQTLKTVSDISGNRAGDAVTFEITVENTGNVSLSNVTVADDITRADGTAITPDPVSVFIDGDTGAQPGILDVGEIWIYSVAYELTQEDIDAGGVTNSALAAGEEPTGVVVDDTSDDDGTGESDPTLAEIPPDPTLAVSKTASVPARVTGTTFTVVFTIDIENTGNVTQNNVSVIDDLSTFLGAATLVNASVTDFAGPSTTAANGGFNGDTDTELLAPGSILAVGDTMTIEIEVIYDGATGDPEGTNTVSVTSDERIDPETASVDVVTEIADAALTAAKSATPTNPIRGDLVTYTIFFENQLSTAETGVTLVDALPVGLVFQEGTALFNGAATPEPTRNGNQLEWGPLTIGAGETIALQFQARVLGGAGEYVNQAFALDPTGVQISPTATAVIEVRAEAVFDCSDVIGKVFDDVDANGTQSRNSDEPGIPGVKVVTTRGTIITTDDFGRFSVPCAEIPERIGSNFTLKLDTRSLPTGYRLTTENPRVLRLTPGKMARMNFGARLGNIVDVDLMAAAFAQTNGERHLKPALMKALRQALRQIKDEPSALRLSYLAINEPTERAVDALDEVEDFIRREWRNLGTYRLSIERVIAVTE